jgi:hypothetical protein
MRFTRSSRYFVEAGSAEAPGVVVRSTNGPQVAGPAMVMARPTSTFRSTALDVMQPPCDAPTIAMRSGSV